MLVRVRVAIGVAGLVLAGVVTAQEGSDDSTQYSFEGGLQRYSAGDAAAAIKVCETRVRLGG